MTQTKESPGNAAAYLTGSVLIGGGSIVVFWNNYNSGIGFWWALVSALAVNLAMSTLGLWLGGKGRNR